MKNLNRYMLLAIALVFAVGCNSQSSTPLGITPQSNNTQAVRYTVIVSPEDWIGVHAQPQSVQTEIQAQQKELFQIESNIAATDDLKEKCQIARTFIEQQDGKILGYFVKQALASDMLHLLLATKDNTEQIAYFTEIMHQNNNADADLIFPALQRLAGTWSPEKISNVEKQVKVSAKEWVAKTLTKARKNCTDCTASTKIKLNDAVQSKLDAIKQAIK